MSEIVERLSALVHGVYCDYYYKRYGVEYWTFGDYEMLDEATKDADRAIAMFILSRKWESTERSMSSKKASGVNNGEEARGG